jgi:hypothetical protein
MDRLPAMASAASLMTVKVPMRLTCTTFAKASSECGPSLPRTFCALATPAQFIYKALGGGPPDA